MKGCKECGKRVPRRNNQVNFVCQALGYCRYCYRMNYPQRRWPISAYWTERLLSPSERLELERNQFEGREQELWDKDFLAEWEDYMDAKKRGEVRI